MGRPEAGEARKSEVVASRFTKVEAAGIDEVRGALNRAEFVRWLVLRHLRTEKARSVVARVEVRDQTCEHCGSAMSAGVCPWC